MFTTLNKILAVFWLALRRVGSQRWLVLATSLGLAIAVAFTLCIPLYADAVHFRLLRERLLGQETASASDSTPLEFYLLYKGVQKDGPQWEDLSLTDGYITGRGVESLRLPLQRLVRLFRTDSFKLFPEQDPTNPQTNYFLDWFEFALIDDPTQELVLVAGSMPQPAAEDDLIIEVLVSQEKSLEFGLQAGDIYYPRRDDGTEFTVLISGVWAPADPKAHYWGAEPGKLLFVSEETYVSRIVPVLKDELRQVGWTLVFDGGNLHSSDIPGLLERFTVVQQRLDDQFAGIKLQDSPLAELEKYQEEAPALTLLLYAFAIPIAGLTLAFIGLVTSMFIAQHQHEIAMLRSRGASVMHAAGMTAAEGLAMAALALLIGIPAGQYMASKIGQARSFLDFTDTIRLRIALTPATLAYALGAILFIVVVQIGLLTVIASQRTIVSYRQERARQTQLPWWQRYYVDLFILLPTAYALFLLRQQGSIAAGRGAESTDPLQNPLLLLAPALIILACTLILLRLVPGLMSLFSWLAARTNSVGFLMASRYLARSPAFYNTPLSLLVLTLSLSAYTASLAFTLDRQLYRQTYYQVGADMSITELGILPPSSPGSGSSGYGPQVNTPIVAASTSYLFNPVDDHLRIPGVQAVSRLGVYNADFVQVGGKQVGGMFIGLDYLTFPRVGYWQDDFAGQPLGVLMNSLASVPDGALVSQDYMDERSLAVGDSLNLVVNTGSSNIPVRFVITGSFELFPAWYPEQGPLVVVKLNDFFAQANGEYPYQVWLRLDRGVDPVGLVRTVRGFTAMVDKKNQSNDVDTNGLNTFVDEWVSAENLILAAQRSPARQGLFGLLSVGFISSALLTVLGFLLYALFSFRRRFIELGMLRAIGLSERQMGGLLASELAFLIGGGLLVGTVLGVGVSRIFIPFMQVGATAAERFPPFVTLIAWTSIFQMYALFVGLFLIALSVLISLLLRMKIFQAIKLGETT